MWAGNVVSILALYGIKFAIPEIVAEPMQPGVPFG